MDLQTILRSIRRADIDYDLIEDGERIAVGVSGGKDSMVLLTALHMYSKFQGKSFQVVGIHIKLGFPNMDFQEVVQYCDKLGIEFHMIDSKVYEILQKHPDANGNIKCSLCSKFKKATVIEAAKQLNCHKVAFGHHSDDAVETLMMNAIFGGKLAVFLPKMYMSRTDITFIRPLIYAFEDDILTAQQKNAIPFVESTCPNDGYTQRQEMKDMLHEFYKKYPMARYNFQNMLSNEEQVELWHKSSTRVSKRNHDKPMEILLAQDDLELAQRGRHFFLIYSPKQLPSQRHHKKIPHSDADRILSKQLTLHNYMESIKAELDL